MANSTAESLIGAAVLVVAGGFLLYAGQTAGVTAGGNSYELYARFNNIEGVNVGTDVRLAGVKVGTVTDLSLDETTYQATVRLSVIDRIKVPDDSDISIASEGLLGGAFVAIAPGASDYMLQDGEEITLTQSAISVVNLLLKFATGGDG